MNLNINLSDYTINAIQSIEMYDVRGGPGNPVLMRLEGPMTTELTLREKTKPLSPMFFKCRYCDVIQKEFYSNCPNCGAPMEVHEQIISKAVPISGSADSGASYGMAATFSSGMYELS